MLGFLILIIIVGLIVYGFYIQMKNQLMTTQYRIALIDPINHTRAFLQSVDGISQQFQHTLSEDNALTIKDLNTAQRILSSLPDDVYPSIQVKDNFIKPWRNL